MCINYLTLPKSLEKKQVLNYWFPWLLVTIHCRNTSGNAGPNELDQNTLPKAGSVYFIAEYARIAKIIK